jgi:hypothetical protein
MYNDDEEMRPRAAYSQRPGYDDPVVLPKRRWETSTLVLGGLFVAGAIGLALFTSYGPPLVPLAPDDKVPIVERGVDPYADGVTRQFTPTDVSPPANPQSMSDASDPSKGFVPDKPLDGSAIDQSITQPYRGPSDAAGFIPVSFNSPSMVDRFADVITDVGKNVGKQALKVAGYAQKPVYVAPPVQGNPPRDVQLRVPIHEEIPDPQLTNPDYPVYDDAPLPPPPAPKIDPYPYYQPDPDNPL